MAILSRPRIAPQQRFDLEDWNAHLSSLRTDSKLWTKQFLSSENLILKGFSVSGVGAKQAVVDMADATLIIPENSNDFSWFTSSPSEPNITVTDAELTDNSRNYLELVLRTEGNTPLSKAFWDPEANSGEGREFTQIVDTITDLDVTISVSTGGFSGSVDRLPLAIVDTDASGTIKLILDRRDLFFRLSRPNDLNNEFSWGSKLEPIYTMTLSGVTGTFTAGETITISGETATVVTGGTTTITFNSPSGINFSHGDAVTGSDSSATGTVDTIVESFSGVDKSISDFKEMLDALMTEIKLMKGTTYWWENATTSLVGANKWIDTLIVQASTNESKWSWDGSNFSITDESATPLSSDAIAQIRTLGEDRLITLQRQDGQDSTSTIAIAEKQVLFVKVPLTGDRSFSGIGSSDTNYQVVDIATYAPSDESYWIAYRENNKLYVRGYGELEAGEAVPISDPAREDLEAAIAQNKLEENQDRNAKLIEGGTWSLVDNAGTLELTLSETAYIQVLGLSKNRNSIAAQTINLPNSDSVAYVEINRDSGIADTLTVSVANDNTIVSNSDDLIVIARRVTDGVLIGQTFLLTPGDYLELDGAKAEIDRLLGQLKINRDLTAPERATIASAQTDLLDGNTLGQAVGNFLLDFSGRVIDFSTGNIYESDGVTLTGTTFTPYAIPVGESFWYGISLIPGNTTGINKQQATVQIDQASTSAALASNAPFPVVSGDIKLGFVRVENDAGTLSVNEIIRFGVGSGSGSGSGDANSLTETIDDLLNDSIYNLATPVVAQTDQSDGLDPSSTAEYDAATKTYLYSAISETFVSTDLLDLSELGVSYLSRVDLFARWALDNIDTSAMYQVSRNGGSEWQTVTMERNGLTGDYYGTHQFTEEAINQVLFDEGSGGGATLALSDSAKKIAGSFVISALGELRSIDLEISVLGSPVGILSARIVRDDGSGLPSDDPADVLIELDPVDITTLATGTHTFDVSNLLLDADTYFLVLDPDQAYLDQHTASSGLDALFINYLSSGAGATQVLPSYTGATWTSNPGTIAASFEGIEYDLRVKITSSMADVNLEGIGLLYDTESTLPVYSEKDLEIHHISGDDDVTDFEVTAFTVDPTLVKVYDVSAGQVYKYGAFSVDGQTIKFPAGTFLVPGEVITLHIEQLQAGSFDNSDVNAQLLAANHLGSSTPALDKSLPGRGILLRSPDGSLWELSIENDGSILTTKV